MKKILLLVYIAGALTASALAHAAIVVNVTSAQLDQQTLNLTVSMSLADPCLGQPMAQMTRSEKDPMVLNVEFVTQEFGSGYCVQRIVNSQTEVSLPMLAKAENISVDQKAIYTVRIKGSDYQYLVSGSDLGSL